MQMEDVWMDLRTVLYRPSKISSIYIYTYEFPAFLSGQKMCMSSNKEYDLIHCGFNEILPVLRANYVFNIPCKLF